MSSAPLLQVVDVVKRFGGLSAVDGASLEVERGSLTALIGPNGAGKSTLFNVVSGFARADGGRVLLDGRRIDGKGPHAIAARGLARTFQTARAFTKMTVLENMLVAAPRQPGEHVWRLVVQGRAARRREREVHEQARALLRLVRLDGLAADYAGTLSGGQRKLLDFARLLMAEPALVLLDEPMAGVNPALADQLLEHVLAMRAERGTTFFLIEHDLDTVMSISDRVVVMSEGRVIAADVPAAVRADAGVLDAYLGAPVPST